MSTTSSMTTTTNATHATYAKLFPEQFADRCSPDALESNSGPIAYLHALYQHALQIEASSTSDKRMTLSKRRPDIAELVLSQEALNKEIKPLTLAINALARQAQNHLGTDENLPKALSQSQYTAGLPYHYPLQQIQAVLRHKKLPLFEVLQAAEYSFPNFCYGQLRTEELREVMRNACGFSPALQALLLDDTASSDAEFLSKRFSVTGTDALKKLRKVEFFCEKTGLKPQQVKDLLAVSGIADNASQGFTSVKCSNAFQPANNPAAAGHLFGAAFINDGKAAALTLEDTLAGAGITLSIKGGTAAHFGRIHKIIHLQHALQLPFADIDLLLMSTLRAEGQTKDFKITENTLRALGVFRYFHESFGVTAEQFSALIHEVTPYAVDDRVPFLDRVLDGPSAGQLANIDDQLIIDNREFDPATDVDDTGKSAAQTTMGRLCRALGMNEALANFYLTQAQTALGLTKPRLSLTLVSSLYRLSRLPRLLRLSFEEGVALIALLSIGNSQLSDRLAGKGKIHNDEDNPDILDVLTGLANLLRWLRRESLTAQTVLRLLAPVPAQISEGLNAVYGIDARLKGAISQALPQLRESLVTEARIQEAVGAGIQLAASNKWLDTLNPMINELGVLKQHNASKSFVEPLKTALEDKLTDEKQKAKAITAIETLLINARVAQEDITRNIISTAFNDGAQNKGISADHVLPLLRWMGSAPLNVLTDVLAAAASSDETPTPLSSLSLNLWGTLSNYAQVVKLTQLSPAGLTALLENPQWFDLDTESPADAVEEDTPPTPAELNLDLLYQLTRYRAWIDICRTHQFEESDALDYLKTVPGSDEDGAVQTSAKRLGKLIGWATSETEQALPYLTISTPLAQQIIKKSYDEFLTLLTTDEKKHRTCTILEILINYHKLGKNGYFIDPLINSIYRKFKIFMSGDSSPLKVTRKQYDAGYKPVIWERKAKAKASANIKLENPDFLEIKVYSTQEQQLATGTATTEHQVQTVASTITDIDYVLRLRDLCTLTGLSCEALMDFSLLDHNATYEQFHTVGQLLVAACDDEAIDAIQPALQEQWRDALLAYLTGYWVSSDENLRALLPTTDDLSGYFLTDIGVSSEAQKTTAITQAIGNLQHYLHRLYSHLEPGYDAATLSEEDTTHWHTYLSQYGTWKNWRTQINHPENLIYYANRPNKSTAFQELEVEVNQGKLDPELLQTAICNYLSKFERLSNLQIVSGYLDGRDPKNDTYYLIGKTNTTPHEYYLRSVDMSLRDNKERLSPLAWSEWQKVGLTPTGNIVQTAHTIKIKDDSGAETATTRMSDAVRPVIIAGRPYVFWVERGSTRLPSPDPSNKETIAFKKVSVHYTYLQSDGFWSPANELINLDGHDASGACPKDKEGKCVKDHENKFLIPENDPLSLIVFVNVEGEREADPWLTVILHTWSLAPTDDHLPKGAFFLEMRDLLLIEKKSLSQDEEKHLAYIAASSYLDDQRVQHPYDGQTKTLEATQIKANAIEVSSNPGGGYIVTVKKLGLTVTPAKEQRALDIKISILEGEIVPPAYGTSITKYFNVKASITSPGGSVWEEKTTRSTNIKNRALINYTATADGAYTLDIEFIVNHTKAVKQRFTFNVGPAKRDEDWGATLIHNPVQAQYLDLTPASNQLPKYPSNFVRLNTLFGKQLVARASQSIELALGWATQQLQEPTIEKSDPSPAVDFHGANGLYFRELFLHLPTLVATRLTEQQQYEDAESWYLRYLFDPYRATKSEDKRPAYWNTRPLAEVGTLGSELQKSVDPTARAFILSRYYQQAVFLSLVENWQRQGDHYYRQLTLSTLNHAWLCYQQALQLVGPLPERADVSRWSAQPLAAVEDSDMRPPINSRVLDLRKTLLSRLYNLRHGLTIDGKALPNLGWGDEGADPFASAKGGLSIVQNSYNSDRANIPAYHFRQLLPAARAAAQQLLDMGRHYMKLMEDEFNTTLSVLLKAQEIKISDFTQRLQVEAINTTKAKKKALEISRAAAEFRGAFYANLISIGRSPVEEAATAMSYLSAIYNTASLPFEAASAGLKAITPIIFGVAFGGNDPSAILKSASIACKRIGTATNFLSTQLKTEAEYERRAVGWQFDLDQTEWDIKLIDQQLAATNIELNAAIISYDATKQERANLEEAYVAMTTGFTIIPIYNWLVARQELIYGAAYDAVLSLCLSLEAAWRYEIGDYGRSAFIKTNAWSDSYKGMLAGESLLVDLQEMENAYLQANERRLTIKKSFSLNKLLTQAGLAKGLKDLSKAKPLLFEFKATDFDKNHPGQYLRQLKHVSVSFILKDGSTVEEMSAILTQTGNSTLVKPDADGADYCYGKRTELPASIKRNLRAQQQIALSSLVAEDGLGFAPGEWVYELMFHDGRYLPFEGTGAISQWQLEIPDNELAESLKDSVTDIQVNLVYTALPGDSGFVQKIGQLRTEK